MSTEQRDSTVDPEEETGFAEEMPEDFYAAEELMLGALSKCRRPGAGKKKKTVDKYMDSES
ncbi:hypothetical protein [Hyperthermus butylicus]|uniref:hypothetical protein n=1 Tax=Hyperthermus butylicus TaxID=54248 RepID=UPI000325D162|nr:hypothetical protein [Hyperthermus butylicus]